MNGGPRTVFAVDGYQVVVVLVEIIRAFFRLAWSDGQPSDLIMAQALAV